MIFACFVAAAGLASIIHLLRNPSSTVAATVLKKDVLNHRCEPLILLLINVVRRTEPLAITAATNVERIAKVTHFKSVFVYRRNRFVDLGYSCWLKMANAFLRCRALGECVEVLHEAGELIRRAPRPPGRFRRSDRLSSDKSGSYFLCRDSLRPSSENARRVPFELLLA